MFSDIEIHKETGDGYLNCAFDPEAETWSCVWCENDLQKPLHYSGEV